MSPLPPTEAIKRVILRIPITSFGVLVSDFKTLAEFAFLIPVYRVRTVHGFNLYNQVCSSAPCGADLPFTTCRLLICSMRDGTMWILCSRGYVIILKIDYGPFLFFFTPSVEMTGKKKNSTSSGKGLPDVTRSPRMVFNDLFVPSHSSVGVQQKNCLPQKRSKLMEIYGIFGLF